MKKIYVILFLILNTETPSIIETETPKQSEMDNANPRLVELYKQKNKDFKYSEDEVLENIMKVYARNSSVGFNNKHSVYDIEKYLKLGFVDIIGNDFIARFQTELREFIIVFSANGWIFATINLNKEDLNKEDFDNLKEGMSIEEVKRFDSSTIVSEKIPLIFESKLEYYSDIISEHIFSDGSIGVIEYRKVKNDYVITKKYISDYSNPQITDALLYIRGEIDMDPYYN